MTYYQAQGTCNRCGRYSCAVGADAEDATRLLHNDHGNEHKHAFEGEVVVVKVDDNHSKR